MLLIVFNLHEFKDTKGDESLNGIPIFVSQLFFCLRESLKSNALEDQPAKTGKILDMAM